MATIVPREADISSVTVFKFSGNQPNYPPISMSFQSVLLVQRADLASTHGSVPGHGCITIKKRILYCVASVQERCLKES